MMRSGGCRNDDVALSCRCRQCFGEILRSIGQAGRRIEMSGALRTMRVLPVCLVLLTFSCARKESLAGTPERPMGSSPPAAPYVSRASEIRVAYRPISIPDSLKPASEAAVQFEARNT